MTTGMPITLQTTPWWVYGLLLLSIACSSTAQVFQKLAARDLSQHHGAMWRVLLKRNVLLSVVLLGTGLCLWLIVLGRMELSIAYPMLSLGYVVVIIIAKVKFQEDIPLRRWLGTFLIMLGISVLVGGVL